MRYIRVIKLYRCLEPNCLDTVAFEFLDLDNDHQLVCQKHSNKYKRRGFTLTRTTPEMLAMYQDVNYGFYELRNAITKFRLHNSDKFKGFKWNKNKIIGNAAELLDDKDLELSDELREVLIKLRNVDVWINTLDMELEKFGTFLDNASNLLKPDNR